jgi:effector-binding domain-containing protein
MKKPGILFFIVPFILLWMSCNEEDDFMRTENKEPVVAESQAPPEYREKEGFAGVMDVPEMLCLSKIDSADISEVAARVAQNYRLLQSELKRIGAVPDGPAGQINYNNDPHNFKFECFLLIREIPEQQPRNCSIVVLEASKMLIYNYYGPYQELHFAYNQMKDFCRTHNLVQSGPQREFYVTDPTVEPDGQKLLTRIMLPVEEKK